MTETWIAIGLQTVILIGGAWRYTIANDRKQEARHSENRRDIAVIKEQIKLILDGRVRIDRRM